MFAHIAALEAVHAGKPETIKRRGRKESDEGGAQTMAKWSSYGAGVVKGLPFSVTKVATILTGEPPLLMPS